LIERGEVDQNRRRLNSAATRVAKGEKQRTVMIGKAKRMGISYLWRWTKTKKGSPKRYQQSIRQVRQKRSQMKSERGLKKENKPEECGSMP